MEPDLAAEQTKRKKERNIRGCFSLHLEIAGEIRVRTDRLCRDAHQGQASRDSRRDGPGQAKVRSGHNRTPRARSPSGPAYVPFPHGCLLLLLLLAHGATEDLASRRASKHL